MFLRGLKMPGEAQGEGAQGEEAHRRSGGGLPGDGGAVGVVARKRVGDGAAASIRGRLTGGAGASPPRGRAAVAHGVLPANSPPAKSAGTEQKMAGKAAGSPSKVSPRRGLGGVGVGGGGKGRGGGVGVASRRELGLWVGV